LGWANESLWQWAEAGKEFKRAIELIRIIQPRITGIQFFLRNMGRYDESATIITRAHELDPLSSVISVNVSRVDQVQNNHAASIENSLKIIELDPNFGCGLSVPGAVSYLKQGRNAEAIAAGEKAVELAKRSGVTLGDWDMSMPATGKQTEARSVIRELEDTIRAERSDRTGYRRGFMRGLGEKG
jgi:tetratricopeptide (TPR) repeat protein